MHPHPIMGPLGALLVVAFGATAALLLVGGSILLRWQRGKQRFQLTQAALDKGLPALPDLPPFWVLSLRSGVMTLTLGSALLLTGGIAYSSYKDAKPPTAAEIEASASSPLAKAEAPPPLPPELDQDGPGPRGERPLGPPPPLNPVLEEWHHAMQMRTIGSLAAACGFILTLLGLVRTIFAFVERGYARGASVTAR